MGEWTQLKSHYDSHRDAEELARRMGSYGEVKNSYEVVENCMKNKMKGLLLKTQSEKRNKLE